MGAPRRLAAFSAILTFLAGMAIAQPAGAVRLSFGVGAVAPWRHGEAADRRTCRLFGRSCSEPRQL